MINPETSLVQKIIKHPALLLIVGTFIVIFFMVIGGNTMQAISPNKGRTDWADLAASVVITGMCVLGYVLFVWFIERKLLNDFALSGAGREWLFGAAVGTGAMVVVVGIIWALGGYQVTGRNGAEILVGVLSVAIVSGVTEEILLRGLIFRFLEQWLGSLAALALSALLFGLLHLNNPNSSWLAAFAIALEAGILLGAIYMLTRRLWAAIGLHMAWNSVQGGAVSS